MSRIVCVAMILFLTVAPAAFAEEEAAPAPIALDTEKARISYTLGTQIGQTLVQLGVDIDMGIMVRAMEDVLADRDPAMTDEELQATMGAIQNAARERQMARMEEQGRENSAVGETFLAANAEKDGVVVLPSGLQYKVITEGTGATPSSTDKVRTHYRGTFIDGEQFDSSYDRGEPAEFAVTGVIAGWTEALQLMKVGAKWELYISGSLAYGPSGRGGIPPNATLLFEIELLDIVE